MNIVQGIKKISCAAAAVMMFSGAALAATPAEVYEEAAQNMAARPDGEYVVQLDMSLPLVGKAQLVNTVDMKANPFQVKSAASVSVLGKGMTSQTYVEQDKDVLRAYYTSSQDGQASWKKAERKLSSAEPFIKQQKDGQNVMDGVTSVTLAGTNEYTVVYDTSRLGQHMDEEKWRQEGLSERQIEAAAAVFQALRQAGDVTAVVTIDPQTKRIASLVLPLTPQLRAIAQSMVEKYAATDANKAVLQQFIQYSDMSLRIDCNALPDTADLTVPDDVRAQAVAVAPSPQES